MNILFDILLFILLFLSCFIIGCGICIINDKSINGQSYIKNTSYLKKLVDETPLPSKRK